MIIAFSQANISNRKDMSRDEENLFCFAHKTQTKMKMLINSYFFDRDVRRRFDKIDELANVRLDVEDAVAFVVVIGDLK